MVSASPSPTIPADFRAINPLLLELCSRSPTSLYRLGPDSATPVLLGKPGQEIDEDNLSLLRQDDTHRLIVTHHGFLQLSEELTRKSPSVLQDERLSLGERFSILLAGAAAEAGRASALLKPERLVELHKRVAGEVCELLEVGRVDPPSLVRAWRDGPQWFSHAASVCLYSAVLGNAMGVRDAAELRRLALGAMLHDIGLWKFYRSGDKLSREERAALISQHPQAGYELLLNDAEIDQRQRLIVYQHHECPNGNGFPVELVGDEIDAWSAWVRVVDAFDEMTTVASDPRQRLIGIALARLEDQAGTTFDREAVQCWTRLMTRA